MRQVDVDDILIGQGFTLLRFTGQIDPEGRDWLLEALHRQDETYPGGEYAQMIHDLTGFGDQLRHDHEHPEMAASTVTGTAATRGKDHESKKQTRAKRSKEKQGKSAKKSSWFVITDFQSPLVASWLERRVETIAADPHWQRWWSSTGLKQLRLCVTPHDPSHRHEKVHFHQKKRHLDVVADPADLSTAVETFMHGGARKRFLDDLMQSPQFNATVDEWMRRLLAETADHLGIKTPLPKMPPTQ